MDTINPVINAVKRDKVGREKTPAFSIAAKSGSAAGEIENKVAPSTDWLQHPSVGKEPPFLKRSKKCKTGGNEM
jgi:hypothetical protein